MTEIKTPLQVLKENGLERKDWLLNNDLAIKKVEECCIDLEVALLNEVHAPL